MGIPNSESIVELRRICKYFPGVQANDEVNLRIEAGEVHALLGENGAGKTTLMNILSGHYLPDQGEIWVDGKLVKFYSPRDAIEAGIGMVHQHFRLVDAFTVAENITLGLDRPRFRINYQEIENQISEIANTYGLRINPRRFIWQLSVGERQRVEILKMLYRDVQVLIMDEPTAVLTPRETQDLMGILKDLISTGRSVIFISHKIKEVLDVADRITVLRRGKKVATAKKSDVDAKKISQMMVGQEISTSIEVEHDTNGQVLLSIEGLNVRGNLGSLTVRDFNLEIQSHEIVGLAGVAGNGQRELAECIYGLRPAEAGKIHASNLEITNFPPNKIIEAGVRLIPEDRLGMGLVPNLSIEENLILMSYRDDRFGRGPILRRASIRDTSRELIETFSVKPSSPDIPVWKLSGGNLQRLLLAREISSNPKILIAHNPTRGLDLRSTSDIQQLLIRERNHGAAILLISEDLDTIFALSDRIGAIYEGSLMDIFPRERATIEKIGLLMAGYHEE